eukprot:Pgem_evm1s10203
MQFSTSTLALSICIITKVVTADQKVQQVYLDTQMYPLAVCNDGSPAMYAFQPSSSGSKKWAVMLEGGGQCYDHVSCTDRGIDTRSLTTSNSVEWGSAIESGKALFSKDSTRNPELHDANKVYIHYCSSDGWMGSKMNSTVLGWNFQGNNIVRSVFKDLQTKGLDDESFVVFGGFSAGGRGAMTNIESVKEELPQNTKLVGLFDSALYLDMEGPSGRILQSHTQKIFKFANATGILNSCGEVHQGEEGWRCMFGQFRMPLVIKKFPSIVISDQGDGYYRGAQLQNQKEYYAEFYNRMSAFVDELYASNTSFPLAVYSPSCGAHAVSLDRKYYDQHITNLDIHYPNNEKVGKEHSSVADIVNTFLKKYSTNNTNVNSCVIIDEGEKTASHCGNEVYC